MLDAGLSPVAIVCHRTRHVYFEGTQSECFKQSHVATQAGSCTSYSITLSMFDEFDFYVGVFRHGIVASFSRWTG